MMTSRWKETARRQQCRTPKPVKIRQQMADHGHHAGTGRVPCETMRIANVENNALNWVSISAGAAVDMTHCDFSARAARDEMRHTDVVIGSDRGVQNEGQGTHRFSVSAWQRSWPCHGREQQLRIRACSGWPRVTREDQGLST